MKRIISLFLITLTLLSALGCNNDPANSSKEDENKIDLNSLYEFFIDREDPLYWQLKKYNIQTGTTSPVCTDPVCEHKDDCFFSECKLYTVSGDSVYFVKI